jgi:Holliday junction resolvase RusA-like endonuclease
MISVKLDIVPPTATAQQKGVFVRNGRAHFFTKAKVKQAENLLATLLKPYAPAEPLRGPVHLQARWCFPYRKSEPKRVTAAGLEIPHTVRPDLDNLEKGLLDVLTALRFWGDDNQVYTKSTAKVWGAKPYLRLAMREIDELANDGGHTT